MRRHTIFLFLALALIGAPGVLGAKTQKATVSMDKPRNLFISLEIPGNLSDELEEMQKSLPKEKVFLQLRKQLHVTIAYCPKVTPEKEAELQRFLHDYLANECAIPLKLNGEIVHGSWTRASDPAYHYNDALLQQDEQIRVGLGLHPRLEKFYDAVIVFGKSHELLSADFSQKYTPHITIGVAKEDLSATVISQLKTSKKEYFANEVTLQIESTSSKYEILEQYELKENGNCK